MNAGQEKILKERLERLKNQNKTLREKSAVLRKEKESLEKALKVSQKLLNYNPGAIVLIQDGKLIFINEILRVQLGYNEEEIIGRNFLEFIHPRSKEFVRNLHQRRIAGKSVPDQYEAFLATKSGEPLCCEVRVRKIRHHGRAAFLLNLIGLDEKKQKEKQQMQSEKREALVRMASGLSREFKDCLSIVDKQLPILPNIEYAEDTGYLESLKKIEAAIEKEHLIVRQLDSLADFERQRPGTVLFDLRKAVKDAVELARQNWKEQPEQLGGKTHLKTYLRTISPVEGHPEEIRDAILSIILNAADAMPAGGEIYLTTEENAGFAHIFLQDNGIGVKGDIQDKMFDPFFTTKGGLRPGLGLSLAYAAISRHGGEIEFINLEGQGATCTIKLPLAQVNPLKKVGSPKKRINNSRILIIADEGMVKDLLLQLFVRRKGRVTAVSNSKDGLKALRKNKFNLVIADLNTFPHDPSKIIPKIKKIDPNLPVALVNAESKGKSSRALKKLGADLVIGKPLEMDRIVSRVSCVLR
jgi:PAS domain S-box-containing protein